MEFSRQEYWSELPFSSPGDLPDPGISRVSFINMQILNHQNIHKYPKIIDVFLYQWILFAYWYQAQIYKEMPKLSCFQGNQSDISTLALEENPHLDSSGCWWCLAPGDLRPSSPFQVVVISQELLTTPKGQSSCSQHFHLHVSNVSLIHLVLWTALTSPTMVSWRKLHF